MIRLGQILLAGMLAVASSGTLAQVGNAGGDQKINVVGPTWTSDQKVTTCVRSTGDTQCASFAMPKQFGTMIGIVPLRPAKNANSSWLAISDTLAAYCGMTVSPKKLVCSPMPRLSQSLKDAPNTPRQRLHDTFAQAEPSLKAARKRVSDNLTKNSDPSGAVHTDLEIGDGGDGGGGGGGGGGDGGDGGGDGGGIVVVIPPPPPDDGGDDGGDDGAAWDWPDAPVDPGLSQSPPGSGNTESPARARCTSGAYLAWYAEDLVCKSIRNTRTRLLCEEYNIGEYTYSLDLCKQIP